MNPWHGHDGVRTGQALPLFQDEDRPSLTDVAWRQRP